MAHWRKLGRIFCTDGNSPWRRQYAHLPVPVEIEPGIVRIYFAGLDEHKYGRIGFVDVVADDPTHVLQVSPNPVLDVGEPGLFDDCGVTPSCILRFGSQWRLYYIGWHRGTRVPYQLFTGVATSRDGISFERITRTPVFDRTTSEPFLRSAPSVLATGGSFRAWYDSATGWTTVNGAPYPRYVVRLADSPDGITWSENGPVCIDLDDDEYGIGRPWVIRDPDCYRMWYSIRSHSRPYRMGYAESHDGVMWTRLDNRVGIAASEDGWDSEMICYPAVIDVNGQRLMFYNGNRHGESGFGLAVLEEQ